MSFYVFGKEWDEAFEREYPHRLLIVPTVKAPTDIDGWCRAHLDAVIDYDNNRVEAIAWASENLSNYKVYGSYIGIKDPKEAFWYRMRWH